MPWLWAVKNCPDTRRALGAWFRYWPCPLKVLSALVMSHKRTALIPWGLWVHDFGIGLAPRMLYLTLVTTKHSKILNPRSRSVPNSWWIFSANFKVSLATEPANSYLLTYLLHTFMHAGLAAEPASFMGRSSFCSLRQSRFNSHTHTHFLSLSFFLFFFHDWFAFECETGTRIIHLIIVFRSGFPEIPSNTLGKEQ